MGPLTSTSSLAEYLGQAERWIHRSGEPRLIANLEPEHRLNCARWMLRRADRLLDAVERGMAIGALRTEMSGESEAEPAAWQTAWARELPLYRALVVGLPPGTSARAKHWSGCPVRTTGAAIQACVCHRANCAHLRDRNQPCLCAHLVGREVIVHG